MFDLKCLGRTLRTGLRVINRIENPLMREECLNRRGLGSETLENVLDTWRGWKTRLRVVQNRSGWSEREEG